jgi:hypothetical protein
LAGICPSQAAEGAQRFAGDILSLDHLGMLARPAFFLAYDPAILPGFLIGLFAGAIVFSWLYNSRNGCILEVTPAL